MSLAESRLSGDAHDNGRSLEPLLHEFDDAWANSDIPPAIHQFVVAANLPTSVARLKFTEELIKIDLEYRWRRRHALTGVSWTLEDYAEQLQLAEPFPSNELIGEEYWVRQLWGDGPSHAEFLDRYAQRGEALRRTLTQLDAELAQQPNGLEADENRRHSVDETPRSLPAFETSPLSGIVGPKPVVPGYKILDVLDHGGMAVVYRARQLSLNRIVALKVIRSGEHASLKELDRFRAEAEAVASLRHPNIVQVFEAGQWNGMPYCAMELVAGGSLARKLNGVPLEADSAARLTAKLARALEAAHQAGIVHRDLKPANVLLEPTLHCDGLELHLEPGGPQYFEPKVADFGLAKRQGELTLHTATGELLGTPSYMAPEQAAGNQASIGPRTDVYALGVMLYETLTGHPPFRATTSLETVRQVMRDNPVSLRRLQPDVPRDLETICFKCLEKSPAKRYSSAAELAQDLERFLSGRPVLARRAGLVERAAKWSRRNPAWAVAIGAVAVAAIGILAATARHNRLLQAEVTRANASMAEANRQRNQTLANFNSTQETLLGMLTRLWQESELSDDATQKKLRDNLLQSMLQYYDGVPIDKSASDPDSRLSNALATFHAAHVHHYLEEYAEAESQFRSALPTFEELATDHPENVTYRRWWALCCLRLGTTLSESNDRRQALHWFRRVLTILDGALSEDPALRGLEARCRLELARLCETPKEIAEAISQAEKATSLWRLILSAEPDNDENRWKLCVALSVLSRLLSSDGETREAEAMIAECADTSKKWKGEAGSYYVLNSRVELADSLRILALRAALEERYDEALAHFQTAIGLLDDIVKQNPHYANARSVAHGVYWTRAMIYARMGLEQQALKDWDRCVDVSEGDLRDIAWIGRAKARLTKRDFQQAAADADELLATRELRPEMLFDLAVLYCECANLAGPRNSLDLDVHHGERHELAARAVQCLRQCQPTGFFSDASRRRDLETMPVLSILRDRRDFQKLLDDVAVGSID